MQLLSDTELPVVCPRHDLQKILRYLNINCIMSVRGIYVCPSFEYIQSTACYATSAHGSPILIQCQNFRAVTFGYHAKFGSSTSNRFYRTTLCASVVIAVGWCPSVSHVGALYPDG